LKILKNLSFQFLEILFYYYFIILKNTKHKQTEKMKEESKEFVAFKSGTNNIIDGHTPLRENSKLTIISSPNKEIDSIQKYDPLFSHVLWHSTSHILGWALELRYPEISLCDGPAIQNGFFYEFQLPNQKAISSEELPDLEKLANQILKQQTFKFERLPISKQLALEMFRHNKFKQEIINQINNNNNNENQNQSQISVYRCGDFVDLCRGPHLLNTKFIKSITLTKNSASYWQGNEKNESLQRIYGISFVSQSHSNNWKIQQEEAQKRDHRVLGKSQQLFFFDPLSAGVCVCVCVFCFSFILNFFMFFFPNQKQVPLFSYHTERES